MSRKAGKIRVEDDLNHTGGSEQNCHGGHQGVLRMKVVARGLVWCTGLDGMMK